MAAFEDKIQALMDEFYTEWQKNDGKSKWDVLSGFSAAHQIAVVFGNLNYQVGNGGISQWIYNGYFHDDAEKLTEYLEIGAKSDERCRTILNRVSELDQYARETDCDRDGYYRDPDDEDGESGFIGDMINCDGFDAWYYEHCGKDDWWDVVRRIIDKARAREIAPAGRREREDTPANPPITVYIENAARPEIGGFTIPLPITAKELRGWLDEIEIGEDRAAVSVNDVSSYLPGLEGALSGDPVPPGSKGDVLPELNYLAAKLAGMNAGEREIFDAALEANRHTKSVAEMINLAGNLNCFEIQPAVSPEMYGEFSLETAFEEFDGVIGALYRTGDEDTSRFMDFVEELRESVDKAAYGRALAGKENGVFTEYGYLTENESAFKEAYRGEEDIPAAYRLFPEPSVMTREPVKVSDTDLAALLTAMHAAGGDYMRDAEYNLRTLFGESTEYFVLMNKAMLNVVPARELYQRDNTFNSIWSSRQPEPDAGAFFLAVTGREGPRVTGHLYELGFAALQETLREYTFDFSRVDAEMRDGSKRVIAFDEWSAMDRRDRGEISSHVRHYDPADEARTNTIIRTMRWACEELRESVTPGEFLSGLNTAYMAGAESPRPDMLRAAQDAAKDMLARGTAEVYRLLPEGPARLTALDAVKSGGLWFSDYRDFAIRREDLPALNKWAERAAAEVFRQAGRDEHKKSHGEEL